MEFTDTETTQSTLIIAPQGKMLVTLRPDGTLEYGADYKPDEAARYLWNSFRFLMPRVGNPPLSGYCAEELRDELVRRGEL